MRYLMMNKPVGYITAMRDDVRPCVADLLSDADKAGLFHVGRLDKDTVGLMILTNNGKLAHSLLSPKHHVEKVYRFEVAEPLPPDAEHKFSEGITLADGYECKSARLVCDPSRTSGEITLTEGKYHQIKRMVASLGNKVVALERISFAEILLDASLSRGEWRYLTESEISSLENKVN